MDKKKYFEKIVGLILEEVSDMQIAAPGGGEMIKDPIGGMVRPDQLENLVIDSLKQCLDMAENRREFGFSRLLKNASMRAELLSELYEDQDDNENLPQMSETRSSERISMNKSKLLDIIRQEVAKINKNLITNLKS